MGMASSWAPSLMRQVYAVQQIELMRPQGNVPLGELGPGQVGCIALGMKSISEASVGDTFCDR